MSQQCKFCEAENENSAKYCIKCGKDLNPVLICNKCNIEYPFGAKYCSKCSSPLFIPLELTVSEGIRFKNREQVVTDLFEIKTKNGSDFKGGYFKFGKCVFDKSENEKIWFPKLTEDKIWKNEFFANEGIFKTTYIGNDPEYINKETNENDNLRWYIFAKFEDNTYRFLGKFKIDRIDREKNEVFYKRESETVFLKEDRRDVLKSIKRSHDTFMREQVFGKNSVNSGSDKKDITQQS